MAISFFKTIFSVSSLMMVTSMLAVTSANAASLSGTIVINGKVPSATSLETTTGDSILTPLGQGYTDRKVGTVIIKSNNAGGFKVSIQSATGGYIAMPEATGANDRLGYTLTLSNPTGTWGDNLTPPDPSTLEDIDFKVANPKEFSTSGTATSSTSVTYDVSITTPVATNLLKGDNYSDTITFSISDL
ncbi:hypothetical protein [Thalassotalea maritima]|uniref:hypothetical protein n=1 Tax=Thalassotalea maritima TaxID=3242416 RepID=UPI0035272819